MRVIVQGEADLSGDFRLDESGRIYMPLIAPIRAAGMRVTDLRVAITNALKPNYLVDPTVQIERLAEPRGGADAMNQRLQESSAYSLTEGNRHRVIIDSLRVRSAPSANSVVVGGLSRGDVVFVLEEKEEWSGVRATDSRGQVLLQGWVASRFLSPAN